MKTQHTPGPWTVTETGIFSQHLNGHGNFYIAALPFPSEPPTKTEAANLALIAAAPELLQALKDAKHYLEIHADDPRTRSFISLQLNQVISKATA